MRQRLTVFCSFNGICLEGAIFCFSFDGKRDTDQKVDNRSSIVVALKVVYRMDSVGCPDK